ncbi:uncharacterized protein LOC144866392 [Branchiostoma floridae x Branchiostoma japonicum]
MSGHDFLGLNSIDVYNAYTGKYYRFFCPSGICGLSTDSADWGGHAVRDITLNYHRTHSLTIRTNAADYSLSSETLTVEIYADGCNDVCVTRTVSGFTSLG